MVRYATLSQRRGGAPRVGAPKCRSVDGLGGVYGLREVLGGGVGLGGETRRGREVYGGWFALGVKRCRGWELLGGGVALGMERHRGREGAPRLLKPGDALARPWRTPTARRRRWNTHARVETRERVVLPAMSQPRASLRVDHLLQCDQSRPFFFNAFLSCQQTKPTVFISLNLLGGVNQIWDCSEPELHTI